MKVTFAIICWFSISASRAGSFPEYWALFSLTFPQLFYSSLFGFLQGLKSLQFVSLIQHFDCLSPNLNCTLRIIAANNGACSWEMSGVKWINALYPFFPATAATERFCSGEVSFHQIFLSYAYGVLVPFYRRFHWTHYEKRTKRVS